MRQTGPQISRSLIASLFLVFNVGLPVLIDTCPMPKPAGSMMCPLCHEDEGAGEVLKGKPCCTPSVAAPGNTNEFLRVRNSVPDPSVAVCVIPHICVIAHSSDSPLQISGLTHWQYAPDDIPVIYSSLLI